MSVEAVTHAGREGHEVQVNTLNKFSGSQIRVVLPNDRVAGLDNKPLMLLVNKTPWGDDWAFTQMDADDLDELITVLQYYKTVIEP